QQELRHPPVVVARLLRTPTAIAKAVRLIDYEQSRVAVVGGAILPDQIHDACAVVAEDAVQERHVAAVQLALQALQPVRLDQVAARATLFWRHEGKRRARGVVGLLAGRAHVAPGATTRLGRRIRLEGDLVPEVALGRLAGHVDTGARGVELPAVVDAAQAALLV